MTSHVQMTVTCAHCQTDNRVLILASTSSFGSADLDTRPAPMTRYALEQQIQQCRVCNYCAPDLDDRICTPSDVDAAIGHDRSCGAPVAG